MKAHYRLVRVGKCSEPQLVLPNDVRVADFRLGKTDMVIGYYEKSVTYSWGDFGRLATEAELKQLFAEQYPEPPRTSWWCIAYCTRRQCS